MFVYTLRSIHKITNKANPNFSHNPGIAEYIQEIKKYIEPFLTRCPRHKPIRNEQPPRTSSSYTCFYDFRYWALLISILGSTHNTKNIIPAITSRKFSLPTNNLKIRQETTYFMVWMLWSFHHSPASLFELGGVSGGRWECLIILGSRSIHF